ncbi:MAG: class I adenylate-forming enzyme family protein [Parahaliea sp.]
MTPFTEALRAHYKHLGAWSEHSLYEYLKQRADLYPDRLAIVDPGDRERFCRGAPVRMDYRTFLARVDSLATILERLGVCAGDVVTVQLPNIWELVACYFALARLGAVISPIAVQYRARELQNSLEQTRSRTYITSTNFKGFDFASYVLERLPNAFDKVLVVEELAPNGAASLPLLTENYTLLPDGEAALVDADSIVTICWTSGTEGLPKGVPKTHNNWRASGFGVIDGFGIVEAETLLLPFPLINTAAVGGMMMPWLLCGGTLVLHHPFDVEVFLRQLVEEKVTVTLAAPALLSMLLDDRHLRQKLEGSSLRKVGTGSAPPSPMLLRDYQEKLGISVINMFGSNEGMLLCSDCELMPEPEQRARFFPRVGVPGIHWSNRGANWMRTKLVDCDSGEVIEEPGRPGELAFQGPSLFPGYYRNGGLDRTAFDEDGYYRTGDLFEIVADEQGPRFLRVIGRQKEIIIRGGFNISPAELDALLVEMPGIREIACAGIPDQRLGERIAAYAVVDHDATITLPTICEFLEQRGLARIKWPERLVLLSELPRNALNKVVRSALAAQPVLSEEGLS